MNWKQLLCDQRSVSYQRRRRTDDLRTEFQKDYHRIICSASFRRLQDKTQVFPLEQNDFVRTRLTHSLEVSSFAKSLGQMTFQYLLDHQTDPEITPDVKDSVCSILECAGLLHDIGNPPFGHFGEASIRDWFAEKLPLLQFQGKPLTKLLTPQMQADFCHFEGNAQALRLLSKLHYLIDENGMHLTFALLNTLIKYPVDSTQTDKASPDIRRHKMGYYLAEQALFEEISRATGTNGCRYPLTFLLEAADDIAYLTADTEDAVKKGLLTYDKLLHELEAYRPKLQPDADAKSYDLCINILREKRQYAEQNDIPDPDMNAVQNWVIAVQSILLRSASEVFTTHYAEIMAGTFPDALLSRAAAQGISAALQDIAVRYIYDAKPILALEISAGHMIRFLLNQFVPAAIKYDTNAPLSPIEDRVMRTLPENYRKIYAHYAAGQDAVYRLYLRLLLVTDDICGMTDSYAKRMYQQFGGFQ